MGLGGRVTLGLMGLAGAVIALVYLNRIFLALPLYVAAETGHLIHALYATTLAARPELLPQVQGLQDTGFALIVRAVTYGTQSLLPWLRILGAAAYFAGLLLAYLSVARNLERRHALGVLLLALAYPYYRFAFAALPDGWFVALMGLAILTTSRLYHGRPVIHAALVGALAGVMVLFKPQGLALPGAFVALACIDLGLGRRNLRVFMARIATFGAGFLAGANLLAMLANQPVAEPLTFYLGARFDPLFTGELSPAAWITGARALVVMVAASMMLAGLPTLTGLLRVEMRWGWSRGRMRFTLEPQEATFLLTLLTFVGVLLVTAALAVTDIAGGPNRTWGRSFEGLIPLLWLTATPFIGEFDRAAGRWWRIAMGVAPVIGLAGFAACQFDGAWPQAWDAAALTAFGLDSPIYAAAAAAAVVAAGLSMALTAWPAERIWLALFLALGLLSAGRDVVWERAGAAGRNGLGAELLAADAIVSRRPGDVALIAKDPASARLAFWRLRARPQAVLAAAAPASLADVDTVVGVGARAPGAEWRALFQGASVGVYARRASAPAAPRPAAALGSEPGSG